MIVLDAYALIALMRNEPAADKVEETLRGSEEVGIVSINLAEAIDKFTRHYKVSRGDVEATIGPLIEEAVEVVQTSTPMAWRAASMRATHYRRRTSELSLADCFLLAAASDGDRIATNDRAIMKAARLEGIEVLELP